MNNYETLVIVRQEASATQVETTTDELVAIIAAKQGQVARREYWGLLSLAYKIRKNRKGHYILLNYQAPAEVVDDLQYKMRYSEDILRYLTIRTKDLPSEPSIQAQPPADERAEPSLDVDERAESAEKKTNERPVPASLDREGEQINEPAEPVDNGKEEN